MRDLCLAFYLLVGFGYALTMPPHDDLPTAGFVVRVGLWPIGAGAAISCVSRGGVLMADRWLHGNGKTCPACALRREEVIAEHQRHGLDPANTQRLKVDCNTCDGTGRIALTLAEIVAAQVAWNRKNYWPAFDARCAAQNGVAA